MGVFLGIDTGSVSTKLVLMDSHEDLKDKLYLRTNADPVTSLKEGLKQLFAGEYKMEDVLGVGVTGSGKELASMMINADLTKNEISSHAAATLKYFPGARTIIEIGGQDSKIILLKKGLIEDFSMNSVCAAGTGSFLEQQAQRLNITISHLSEMALKSQKELSIAARCTVFAESDMIYKQQIGYAREDIIYGLCLSLAKNYLNTLAKGKKHHPPYCFQGGVAANMGMRKAFEEVLGDKLLIPHDYIYMGAIGAAIFAVRNKNLYGETAFSPSVLEQDFSIDMFLCSHCENRCNVVRYLKNNETVGYRGDICGKYSYKLV